MAFKSMLTGVKCVFWVCVEFVSRFVLSLFDYNGSEYKCDR
jgi:hypothetical protein